MRHGPRAGRGGFATGVAAMVLLVGLTGCDLLREVMDRGGRTAALREAAVDALAGADDRFLGEIGDGPVLRTEAVSDSLLRVVVPEESNPNGEAVWELELTRIDVLPLFPGEDFARFVQERATARDRRGGLTQEGWGLIADGSLLAVGRVEGEARAVARAGRVPVSRIAYLEPVPGEEGGRWSLQPDTRTVLYLWRAVDATYRSFASDERVMECAGVGDPGNLSRPALLRCAEEVLAERFGEEEG